MAGNSSRRGAIRKTGTKKGAVVGSGGQRRKALQPKGPTPKAEERPGHPAARRRRSERDPSGGRGDTGRGPARGDVVAGRNAVYEALKAQVPAKSLLLLDGIEADDRVRAAVALANSAGLPILTATRVELDRAAATANHQGIALQTAAFGYADLGDLPPAAAGALVVALDHITDPQNFGAIARSAAAFGAAALLVPQRRSAPVTASAWKASAGALAGLPVVRVGNLVTSLTDLQRQGYFAIGLDGAGSTAITAVDADLATGPLVLVVGAEGTGLARLTAQTCDLVVRIDMPGRMESLNASVAAGIALHELAGHRSSPRR